MTRFSRMSFRLPDPTEVPGLPRRLPLDVEDPARLGLVMHEYAAIRNEIDTSLSAQISQLSFGSATVGLLVAAAAAVWADEGVLSGLLLLVVVPAASFLALAIHAGEMVRLFRAGLFLNHLECYINSALTGSAAPTAGVLVWEQWRIRDGSPDMAGNNRRAILMVFGLLAFGFMLAGFWRLHEVQRVPEAVAAGVLVLSLGLGVQGLRWVLRLHRYAYLHRMMYRHTCDSTPFRPDTGPAA